MTSPGAAASTIRVLVVDDEVDFATALADRLRRRGFAATPAFSGVEGVRRAEAGEADILILDLKMPGMDGLQVLRELHRLSPAVRAIVLTGHGTVAAGIEGMEIGAVDFLQKPADIDRLCAAIVTAVAAERNRGEEHGGHHT